MFLQSVALEHLRYCKSSEVVTQGLVIFYYLPCCLFQHRSPIRLKLKFFAPFAFRFRASFLKEFVVFGLPALVPFSDFSHLQSPRFCFWNRCGVLRVPPILFWWSRKSEDQEQSRLWWCLLPINSCYYCEVTRRTVKTNHHSWKCLQVFVLGLDWNWNRRSLQVVHLILGHKE